MVYHAEAEIKLFRGVHSAGQKTSYNMAFTNDFYMPYGTLLFSSFWGVTPWVHSGRGKV